MAALYQLTEVLFDAAKLFRNKIVRILLDNSYSIYLFHIPAIYALDELVDTGSLVMDSVIFIPAATVVSVLASCLVKKFNGYVLIGEKAPRKRRYDYIY